MTTAHRPTFDPARGKDAQRGPAYHQRLLPAYTQLKTRQPGQGGNTDSSHHDLRSQLLAAEAAHRQPKSFTASSAVLPADHDAGKRSCEEAAASDELEDEAGRIAKRQRILDATRKLDADSESSASEVSDESEDEDETAELMRELEKIKRERAEQREREEHENAKKGEDQREHDIASGNPLLNRPADFNVRRRWDDDVVFKHQARGTEEKRNREFVNDLLRSDFHKRFMSRYVR